MGYYWPEGMLLETEENRYYLQNEETLQSAMRIGQILEGRALLCDYDQPVPLPGVTELSVRAINRKGVGQDNFAVF